MNCGSYLLSNHQSRKFLSAITCSRHWAFTLVELLVVITIISILTSMMMPVLSNARKAAQMLTCQSNQKQIGLGIFAYTGDYGGWLPRSYDGTQYGCVPWHWLTINPVHPNYIPTDLVRNGCPSYPDDVAKYWNFCYSYNTYLGVYDHNGDQAQLGWYTSYPQTRLSRVKSPSRKFLAADTRNNLFLGAIRVNWNEDRVGWWHNKKANFLHFDLHTKSYHTSNFSDINGVWQTEVETYLKPDK